MIATLMIYLPVWTRASCRDYATGLRLVVLGRGFAVCSPAALVLLIYIRYGIPLRIGAAIFLIFIYLVEIRWE